MLVPWMLFCLTVCRSSLAGTFPSPPVDCGSQECPVAGGGSPVCGSDGRTYGSRCELERARTCQGLPLHLKHEGKCAPERARCAAQRALLLSQGDSGGLFVPECHEDGSYAEVQCHASTGYCWCVDRLGKPVRGSSIQHARPICTLHHNGKGRKTNRRRSSRGRKNKKGCGTNDRANFNANLIDIFQSEYNRVEHQGDRVETETSDPLRDTHEKRVVQWKFDQLDSDGDSALHRSEVRDLRRMARRIVRPRGCARTFAKFCDLDQDRRISRAEWAVCVGVDINNEQIGGLEDFLDDQPSDRSSDGGPSLSGFNSEPWDRESHVPRLYQITPETSDEEVQIPKEEESQDCTSARMAALEIDRQAPGAGTYVPECTASGDYTRAQCHRSTPSYCWCVHPRTGRPIRGTAMQGQRPDCDSTKTKTKNFKGCSLHKKQEFLDELIKSFSKEMQENRSAANMDVANTTPEKAARWKFSSVDTNSNGVLDKREWKVFKTEWKSALQKDSRLKRRLRKCWRNLPRFCDENANQKITMDEWLACTVTTRDSKSNLPRNHRRGKNPLTTILKSD